MGEGEGSVGIEKVIHAAEVSRAGVEPSIKVIADEPDFHIQRLYQHHGGTTGLFINKSPKVDWPIAPLCFILEDRKRDGRKVPGSTRISALTTTLKKRFPEDSDIARKYRDKYGLEFVVEIENVPNFTGIIPHIGNSIRDTRGCPLTGTHANNSFASERTPTIGESTKAYLELHDRIWIPIFRIKERPVIRVLDEEKLLMIR